MAASTTEGRRFTKKNLTFTVTLSAKAATSISVAYATKNGTALAAMDDSSKSGTLTIGDGVGSPCPGYCTRVPEPPREPDAAEPDAYVVARIKDALARDARVAALDIDVHLARDVVALDGTVPTEERRRACADIARAVLRGYTVDNRLVVVHADAPSAIEDIR